MQGDACNTQTSTPLPEFRSAVSLADPGKVGKKFPLGGQRARHLFKLAANLSGRFVGGVEEDSSAMFFRDQTEAVLHGN